jgi:peptidoglycan hydrolase-like protein with peptidoglycan-binding domain
MNMKKFILIVGGVSVGLFIVARVINKRKGESVDSTKSGNDKSDISGVFPLKKGSKGEEVKFVQRLLNEKFNAGLPVDGNFDSATESALISAQNSFRVKTALRAYGTPSGYAKGQVSKGLYDILKQYA